MRCVGFDAGETIHMLKRRIEQLLRYSDKHEKRFLAANEALRLRCGGVSHINRVRGLVCVTSAKGLRELKQGSLPVDRRRNGFVEDRCLEGKHYEF